MTHPQQQQRRHAAAEDELLRDGRDEVIPQRLWPLAGRLGSSLLRLVPSLCRVEDPPR